MYDAWAAVADFAVDRDSPAEGRGGCAPVSACATRPTPVFDHHPFLRPRHAGAFGSSWTSARALDRRQRARDHRVAGQPGQSDRVRRQRGRRHRELMLAGVRRPPGDRRRPALARRGVQPRRDPSDDRFRPTGPRAHAGHPALRARARRLGAFDLQVPQQARAGQQFSGHPSPRQHMAEEEGWFNLFATAPTARLAGPASGSRVVRRSSAGRAGAVYVPEWRPDDGEAEEHPERYLFFGGVARKPPNPASPA